MKLGQSYNTEKQARWWSERGFRVLPLWGVDEHLHVDNEGEEHWFITCRCEDPNCKKQGKHPKGITAWQRAATTDYKKWDWQNTNVGVVLDGHTVVDVDPRNGGDRRAIRDSLPNTLVQVTGGGGDHYLFAGEIPTGKFAEGVDIKSGSSAYIVGGGRTDDWYEVMDSENAVILPLPESVRSQMANKRFTGNDSPVVRETYGQGERDESMTRIAGLFRRWGFDESELLSFMKVVNQSRFDPPLLDNELERIAHSIGSRSAEKDIRELRSHVTKFLTLTGLFNMDPPSWIMQDVWPDGGVSVMFGAPGTMKSFVALEWALHRAANAPWQGKTIVKPAKVLYVAAEGASGLGVRAKAIIREHRLDMDALEPNFLVMNGSVNLMRPDVVEEFEQSLSDHKVTFIVLDTLRKAMSGGDENSVKDIGSIFETLYSWHQYGIETMLIHHSNRGEGRSYRGSSAIEGDADNLLQITRERHQLNNQVIPYKFKDAPDDYVAEIEWAQVAIDNRTTLVSSELNMTTAEELDEIRAQREADRAARAAARAETRNHTAERNEMIRTRYARGDVTQSALAREYNVSQSYISSVINSG